MLIIEGTDLVGKTKVCHDLAAMLPSHVYQHLSRPPANFDHDTQYFELMGRRLIRDRFHLSEFAYKFAQGLEPGISPESLRLIDGHLRLLGTVQVIIYVDDCFLERRHAELAERGEMYDLATIIKANNHYREMALAFRKYRGRKFDVDISFHCHEGHPFLTENEIEHIYQVYTERQRCLQQITGA